SRLISGAGTRYDYWRIAWHSFTAHPLAGVGAGNYDRPYFQQRATTEDVRQPHSIELQALSELGLVGALLLLGFLTALGIGPRWRASARATRRSPRCKLQRAASRATSSPGGCSATSRSGAARWIRPRRCMAARTGSTRSTAGSRSSPAIRRRRADDRAADSSG